MFHVTFMGGSQVRLKEQDNIVVTFLGGTAILHPTLAEKIVRLKKAKDQHGEINDSVVRRTNVITVMGGTVMKSPTLAGEIEKMVHLRDSGLVSEDELLELWREAIKRDDLDVIETLTFMGGTSEAKPSKKEELDSLKHIAGRGLISSEELEDLKQMLSGGSLKPIAVQERLRSLMMPRAVLQQSSDVRTAFPPGPLNFSQG